MNVSQILNIVLALALVALIIWMPSRKDNASESSENNVVDTASIVLNNIHNRKSVRHFTDQQVTKEQLLTLAKAATAAPTARNQQPWAVIAIDDRATLDSLGNVLPYAKMLSTATAAVIICGDMEKALEGAGQQFWIQDCSAATENLLLAAEGIGLGAVWTAVYPDPDRMAGVRSVIDLPEHIIPLNVIPIGYPTGEDMPKEKWLDSNFHYNKW